MVSGIINHPHYIRARIAYNNVKARLRSGKNANASGYVAGHSVGTDVLPVLDSEGNKIIDRVLREKVHQKGLFHPTIRMMIFSEDSEKILIQCRGGNKDFSGGLLATSIGGHFTGDALIYTQLKRCVMKETWEEAGIKNIRPEFRGKYPYSSHGGSNNELVHLFFARYSGPVEANPTEVAWMDWFSTAGMLRFAGIYPEMVSPSLRFDLDKVAEFRSWQRI